MFWLQASLAFVVWIGYGVLLSRRSDGIRRWVTGLSRTARVLGAGGLMIGSLALLVAVLGVVHTLGGFGQNGMALWAWILVTIFGIGFVHSQAMATAMLITLAQEPVTAHQPKTSTSEKQQLRDPHEKPPA